MCWHLSLVANQKSKHSNYLINLRASRIAKHKFTIQHNNISLSDHRVTVILFLFTTKIFHKQIETYTAKSK